MVVVGGLDSDGWSQTEGTRKDPWAQGLGIFDLPSLTWSDQYDPNAGVYDSPEMVKEFYNQG